MVLCLALMLALSRAEIIERMRAPVITQADGFVQVYADCPEDMRREFQGPIARFAADTVSTMYRGLAMKPVRFKKPLLYIHVGNVRTNLPEVVSRVTTNGTQAVTRIFVKSPGHADLAVFRYEVIRAFYRSVIGRETTLKEAVETYRRADPKVRIEDERWDLETWLAGKRGRASPDPIPDEDGIRLLSRVIEPGVASRRDVLVFASRLYISMPQFDLMFVGRYHDLTFREALKLVLVDPRIRFMALAKADEPSVFACGRGEELSAAGLAYSEFLRALADPKRDSKDVETLLEKAETLLNIAYEKAK